jgi:GGDEF domain-containing protein
MGIFAIRARRSPVADPGASGELSDGRWSGLPPRFEAVAEVLASGSDSTGACEVAGRTLAQDGASLEDSLEGLRTTWRLVHGCDPSYVAVKALLAAWSDATLAYLHQISCEDPMTGLATLTHVRSRLTEMLRDGTDHRRALVVCELPDDPRSTLTRAMLLTRLGEAARTVFPGPEVIGRVGARRVVVIADRDERIGARVRVLRALASPLGQEQAGPERPPRIWIEGVPATDAAVRALLDELARS